ncbi:MAG: hypothetical protein OXH00_02910 [Candidatus Poribacteria bacterium]|nr:hypothetical protein [Candidatus Poribacteria bacterium]
MDVQHCRYCGDFYRIDDDEMAIETDDGWVSDVCRSCQTEILENAWQDLPDFYFPFTEE